MSLIQENINRIKQIMGINEVRSGALSYVKDKLPHFPEYVLRDMFPDFNRITTKDDKDYVRRVIEWVRPFSWNLEKDVYINMDFFNQKTQKDLKNRIGGEVWDFIPKDEERHEIQKQKIEKEGLSEPIIVFRFKDMDGFELIEGWHRTVQMFKKYPDGYIYPNVYVGTYPSTYEDYEKRKREIFPDYGEAVGPTDSIYKYIDG